MIVETKRQTAADFDALPEGAYAQLIDGEIVMSSPAPSFEHQNIVSEFVTQMRTFAKTHRLGIVVPSPVDVYLAEAEVFEPDVVFVEHAQDIIVDGKVRGTPALVVEVLSPSNAYHDLVHKKNVYEANGVKEYWVVDPMEQTVEVFENRNGQFVAIAKARKVGHVQSKLLEGFVFDLSSIFPS
jgi:Uma2 family endonuclease